MSWQDAQSYCRKHHDDLATVSDQEDDAAIRAMKPGRAFWIGLRDDVGSWEWALRTEDAEVMNGSIFWGESQPDNKGGVERCVSMTTDGLWFDLNCTIKMPFVCFDGETPSRSSRSQILITWRLIPPKSKHDGVHRKTWKSPGIFINGCFQAYKK